MESLKKLISQPQEFNEEGGHTFQVFTVAPERRAEADAIFTDMQKDKALHKEAWEHIKKEGTSNATLLVALMLEFNKRFDPQTESEQSMSVCASTMIFYEYMSWIKDKVKKDALIKLLGLDEDEDD